VTNKGEKISLPTPMLAALVALFIWMAGGTISFVYLAGRMSATVDNLGNTFTQYQIRADADRKAMQEKIELQALIISDLREKVIRLDERKKDN